MVQNIFDTTPGHINSVFRAQRDRLSGTMSPPYSVVTLKIMAFFSGPDFSNFRPWALCFLKANYREIWSKIGQIWLDHQGQKNFPGEQQWESQKEIRRNGCFCVWPKIKKGHKIYHINHPNGKQNAILLGKGVPRGTLSVRTSWKNQNKLKKRFKLLEIDTSELLIDYYSS